MDDNFPADFNPYPNGEWKILSHETRKPKGSSASTVIRESSNRSVIPPMIEEVVTSPWASVLRGPIWNYRPNRDSGGFCYSDMLFGKPRKALLTDEEKVVKGPVWIPKKPIISSFARQLFKKMKKAAPEATALIEAETRRSLTYKELVEQAKSVASGLRRIGISAGHVIAVVSYNSLESQLIILASVLVGAVFAIIDPTLNSVDTGALLRICCPRLIFCECGNTRLKVEIAMGHLVTRRMPTLVINDYNMASQETSSQHFTFKQLLVEVERDFKPAHRSAAPDNPLFILFTSGTTSTPKGALIPEKFFTLSHMFVSGVDLLGGVNRYTTLMTTPMIWVSTVTSFFLHLWEGNTTVFFRGTPSEAVLMKTFSKYQVAHWMTAPEKLTRLLRWPARLRCPFLKTVFVAGSDFSADTLLKVQDELFGGKIHIYQLYGMTETGILCGNTPLGNKVGSVGRVYFNVKMKVVEPLTGVPLGCCEEGELCFQMDTMMLGYYNSPEETRRTFDSQGYFHTGDLGFYDEQQFVYVTGRLKELIKWKNFQIVPFDVEQALRAHPAVQDATVFGLSHEVDGQIVTAAIILHPHGLDIDPQIICDAVNDKLSYNKRIRGGVYVFSKFPTTATGKIIKRTVMEEVIVRKNKEWTKDNLE